MTYDEFKSGIAKGVIEKTETWFHYVFTNPILALSLSILIFSIFILSSKNFFRPSTFSYNLLLKRVKDDEDSYYSSSKFEMSAWFSGFAVVVIIIILSFMYYDTPKIDTSKTDPIYISYMESQEDIKLSVNSFILDNDKINNISSEHKDSVATYIFNNVESKNVVKTTVAFKQDEDTKMYTVMEVLISYSLEKGEESYIVTKPPLREDVYSYLKGSYYNPVLFVDKTLGGIK